MTQVIGYDATHVNVASIPLSAEVVMGYDTGTADIQWTDPDWNRFALKRKVHIDQGGPGSPVPTATVRDVETGARLVESAVGGTLDWNAGRRTIYCNRDTLARVLAAGWKGDLWLAIPSGTAPLAPPVVPGCTVVAVQYGFHGNYDLSAVFDPWWPARAPSVPGIQFISPTNLRETVDVVLTWDEVPSQNGRAPSDYTVVALGMDGKVYYRQITSFPVVAIPGLTRGWTYEVHVWANGGDIAPPHATLIVHA